MAEGQSFVIAIDFGSTYIGYAFSHDKECHDIFTSTMDGFKERIPNAVLLDKNRKLDCIGDKAKRKYASLTENGKHRQWFYFEWYKTVLHKNAHLTRDIEIFDSEGRPVSGISLFGMVIKYMKHEAEEQVKRAIAGIQDSNILWVLTVPAIWSDSAKQFMREAAHTAGIDGDRLKLVLEPEAAAMYCLDKPLCTVAKHEGGTQFENFHPGQKYVLADLGGGTIDICIHEVLEDNTIREIHRAIGDISGGNDVNISFEQLFVKLFGAPTWLKFKTEYMDEYVELMSNFETKKREFEMCASEKDDEEVIIRIPVGLQDAVREEYNASFADVLQETTYQDRIHYRRNKMLVSYTVMEELFLRTIQSVRDILLGILKDMVDIGEYISVILMVGGFSESKYVRQYLHKEVQGVRLIYPPDGSLAVMKGAVKFGFRRQVDAIAERRAQFTYGFGVCERFVPGIHPESLKYSFDGTAWCEGIFKYIIEKSSILRRNATFGFFSQNLFKEKNSKLCPIAYRLFRSNRLAPMFCLEKEGCFQIGEIIVNPPENGWPDRVYLEIFLVVGETEFLVKVSNFTTKEKYSASLDFL